MKEPPLHSDTLSSGVAFFNEGHFWDAHEQWEELWKDAAGPPRQFLQGLIQLAAALHHLQRGTLPGAVRLIGEASRRLDPFPDGYLGVRRGLVLQRATLDAAAIRSGTDPWTDSRPRPAGFPLLELVIEP